MRRYAARVLEDLYHSFIVVLLQLCGRSTIKLFYFPFILFFLQLYGVLKRKSS